MKSFYILPFTEVLANAFFNTDKEAQDFVANAKNNDHFVAVNYYGEVSGQYIVSLMYEEFVSKEYLVTLADEDIVEDVKKYLDAAYLGDDGLNKDNWEIYDETQKVACFAKCCECNLDFTIDMYRDDLVKYITETCKDSELCVDTEFNFLCKTCYNFLSDER